MAKERAMFWEISVYPTIKAMTKAAGKLSPEDKHGGFDAIVMPIRREKLKGKKWITHPSLGLVLFHRNAVDVNTIAHESNHMAIGYLRRTNPKAIKLSVDDCDDTEEHMCYATGTCADQITRAFYRLGVYEKL